MRTLGRTGSRRLILSTVVGLLLLGALACGTPSEEEPIEIGAILPLTGDSAQWGIPPRRGAELAVNEINAAGGVNGRPLRLLVEDSRCEPREGVAAFNKISAEGVPAILGAVCSSVTLAIAPLAERNETVLISPASTNPKISEAGDFIFRAIPSDILRGEVFAEYLYQDEGVRTVAALYINNEGGVGNKESFKQRFTQLGGTVALEEAYDQGATDIRSQLTNIKASDIDAVLVVSYPTDTILMLRQAQELALSKSLYFQTEAVEDPSVLREAGDAAAGVTYILPAPAEGQTTQRFTESYVNAYDTKPELFAAEAYDIVHLLARALRQAVVTHSAAVQIRDYLYSIEGYGGASGTLTFDENGDVSKPMAIKRVQDGNPELIMVKSASSS